VFSEILNCKATVFAVPSFFHLIYQPQAVLQKEELVHCIEGCKHNKRIYQNKIYVAYYGYAMSICFKYANDKEDAVEIINDGFLKIFKEIYNFKPLSEDLAFGFTSWLRRIMINTSIDHYRKNKHTAIFKDLNEEEETTTAAQEQDVLANLSYNELLKLIQELSPAYRLVFNLYAIEGMTHKEVGQQLNISEGTSKSNFAKARAFLQKKLLQPSPKKEANAY
jgi:RNA polymerase sigma factor (sigma-70 family)